MIRTFFCGAVLAVSGIAPAFADVERTRAIIDQRIADQPELAEAFAWLQEIQRISVQGWGAAAFARVADDILRPYGTDGIITAFEFQEAGQKIAEASYDETIENMLRHLNRGSDQSLELPLSLKRMEGQRAGRIKSERLAKVLVLDSDGDWQVSRIEIEAQQLADQRFKPEDVIRYDLDADGSITIPEITAAIDADPDMGNPRAAATLRALTLVDLDGDGLVERHEMRDLLDLLERTVTEGRPSVPDARLRQAVDDGWADRGPWRRKDPPSDGPDCGPIAPTAEQELIYISAYQGAAATNLMLDGSSTQTTVASVRVEDGDGPIFLLLASATPVVWSLTGDVDRIAQVVVQRPSIHQAEGHAGVAGVPAERVAFLAKGSCVDAMSEYDDRTMPIALLGPWLAWGRTPATILVTYEMTESQIPSGRVTTERSFPVGRFDLILFNQVFEPLGQDFVKAPVDEATASVLAKFWNDSAKGAKGGIFFFEPGAVVTSGPEAFYEIMFGAAGMIQLIKDGTIKVLDRTNGRPHLLLTRPIPHFPTGLRFWHKTRIDLAPGVPRPVGEFQGLQVYSIDEGKCLTDVTCD